MWQTLKISTSTLATCVKRKQKKKENNYHITALEMLIKLTFTRQEINVCLIFIVIKSNLDYWIYNLLIS